MNSPLPTPKHPARPALLWATCLMSGLLGCGGAEAMPTPPAVPPARVATAPASNLWRFGVMADTQWLGEDDGDNPGSVSVGIINQLNEEFIRQKVDLVVQVGDLTSEGGQRAMAIRATYTQALYNAGIAFFPLRGNHEATPQSATAFLQAFPQTRNGMHNATPQEEFEATEDDARTLPQRATGAPFLRGSGFTSPSPKLAGLSYAFDYRDARFLLLDQYTDTPISLQQPWVDLTLASRTPAHAFVFSHQPPICPYQPDSLFGTFPGVPSAAQFAAQDAFITSLSDHGVRYHIFGHDHFHERGTVTTADGSGKNITAIFSAPSANWLYLPRTVTSWYAPEQFPAFQRKVHSQDVNHVGYYIYTVDGANVTADYYGAELPSTFQAADNHGTGAYRVDHTPALTFSKRETFGYGLAGREFLIPPGGSWTAVADSRAGLTAKLLGGSNGQGGLDADGHPLTKAVNTGWQAGPAGLYGPVFTLWGMAALGAPETPDTFALSLEYDPAAVPPGVLEEAWLGLTSPSKGLWVNTVELNSGGNPTLIRGPWAPGYGLGSHGLDASTHTVWAVVDHQGAFAVGPMP